VETERSVSCRLRRFRYETQDRSCGVWLFLFEQDASRLREPPNGMQGLLRGLDAGAYREMATAAGLTVRGWVAGLMMMMMMMMMVMMMMMMMVMVMMMMIAP
jgi:hypothetical protein